LKNPYISPFIGEVRLFVLTLIGSDFGDVGQERIFPVEQEIDSVVTGVTSAQRHRACSSQDKWWLCFQGEVARIGDSCPATETPMAEI
jgi:hypothetical protein